MMPSVLGTPPFIGVAYLIAAVLFFLSLRALSRPAAGQAGIALGIALGMAGMAVAVGVTLYTHEIANLPQIGMAILAGAGMGFVGTHRIALSALPQMFAALLGLTGLAAMLVGVGAYINPLPFGILDTATNGVAAASRIELGLAVAMGAITFGGSIFIVLKRASSARLSLLSSGAGWSAAAMGFALGNIAMIAAGALAGAAGAALACAKAPARGGNYPE